jgi:class 3 adenylate cyclase/ABC-type transport system involved in cytochrome c biogenesis ATPase subunit
MGVVYRAFDDALQRPLAIKRVLSDRVDPVRALRFRREARMAARLNHPSIVHIYEIVETDQGDWIVMELVEGKTLDRMLRDGMLGLSQSVRLAREIAEGLSEAHGHGIVHRDLKASNVMVNAAGRAKILDFGLAKMYRGGTEQDISAPGMLIGTSHAMSPEQAQGLAIDHRSDLFSLGSLLYEMITGVSPFAAATAAETLGRICAYEPQPILDIDPGVPRELAELTHQLLNKSPAHRPHDSSDVAAALERIEHSGSLHAAVRGGLAAPGTPSDTTLSGLTNRPTRQANLPTLTSSERRQITVLCCDVAAAGGTGAEPSQAFDPETLYELMFQLRPLAQMVAQRHEGTLGNVVGNRLLIYFGYPQAYEDDAERAVRAALDLVSESSEHLGRGVTDGLKPALRVGIHTGPAVVSTSPNAPEPVMLGSTLDLALKHQAAAAPGMVVISRATRSLVKRGFITEALDPLSPPAAGGEWLVPYRVREMMDVGDEGIVDLAPMVGRAQELDQLMNRWEQARAGTGQAVLLIGEPGIGKSRLLRAMRERVSEQTAGGAVRWLSAQGSHYTQNTPLHPVVHLLQHTIASEPGSSSLEKLEGLLRTFSLSEALPLFASLLDLSLSTWPSMPSMSPERQREETLEALVALLLEMSEREPVILLIEDLHWLDATTLTWLERLIDQTETAPLLLVMTIRPNILDIPWGSRARVTQIALEALTSDETEHLILLLTGGQTLRPQVQEHIVSKTDGVPLFVEELTRTVLESGDSEDWRELPTTLRDSLTARLARLGTAKEVAQLGSVIGRAFSLKLLAAVSPDNVDSLERELRRLVQSGLVHRRGFGAQTRYAFKHALIRDAAYDSLLKRERQRLHLAVAEALDDPHEPLEKTRPEILAYHYSEGNQPEKAVIHWLEAARQALGRSAHQEALHHGRAGLAALKGIPAGPARDERDHQLQTTFVPAEIEKQGITSPEVERA